MRRPFLIAGVVGIVTGLGACLLDSASITVFALRLGPWERTVAAGQGVTSFQSGVSCDEYNADLSDAVTSEDCAPGLVCVVCELSASGDQPQWISVGPGYYATQVSAGCGDRFVGPCDPDFGCTPSRSGDCSDFYNWLQQGDPGTP